MQHKKRLSNLLMIIMISGCATYQPSSLPKHPDLAQFPMEKGHRLVSISLSQVATLAIEHNPRLKTDYQKSRIATAARYRATLPPDPQISFGFDHPYTEGAGQSDIINGYQTGISTAVSWLISRHAKIDAAQFKLLQTELAFDWQVWQTSLRAQKLYIHLWGETQRLQLLQQQKKLFAQRYLATKQALKTGDVTLTTAATNLVALTQTNARIASLIQRQKLTRIKLNATLGLQANAPWALEPPQNIAIPSRRLIQTAIKKLPKTRPDLLALKAAFRSANAQYREAILRQFPAISIGVTPSSDTSGNKTLGFGININLPIFNGNRGEVAVTKASRHAVKIHYQSRLDQADITIHEVLARIHAVKKALIQIQSHLPELKHLAQLANKAFVNGNLSGTTFLVVETNYLSREQEKLKLHQELLINDLALRTLLGTPLNSLSDHLTSKIHS